jgi:hypothetical protein
MAPEIEALMAAIKAAAVALRAGRVSRHTCTIAVAGAVLAFGVDHDEVYIEAASLADDYVARTLKRMSRKQGSAS